LSAGISLSAAVGFFSLPAAAGFIMTERQKLAFEHPCLLAEETRHPQYMHRLKNGVGIILTVNQGHE